MDTKERTRLGKLVRQYWVEWASMQPNPKPSWLVEWDELDEASKEADRMIGNGLYIEFVHELAGVQLATKTLMEHALKLESALHGWGQLYDDFESKRLVSRFRDFKESFAAELPNVETQ